MRCLVVVPARFASQRFPGKLLELIHGIPIIAHTLARVSRAKLVDTVALATDHDAIANIAQDYRIGKYCNVVRTPSWLESGTQRVAWAVKSMVDPLDLCNTVVVNVQGDHPGVDPDHVDTVIRLVSECADGHVATLCTPVRSEDEFNGESTVKCVVDRFGYAMYFSRSKIPFDGWNPSLAGTVPEDVYMRSKSETAGLGGGPLRHLGIYAFRGDTLVNDIMGLDPCRLDSKESLEQLRWMYHGIRLRVGVVDRAAHSVDTPQDIPQANKEIESLWTRHSLLRSHPAS
jgi:3-deoxy-manno-octulosonate cytidylyltransferase (CMP-KDO synthetase)